MSRNTSRRNAQRIEHVAARPDLHSTSPATANPFESLYLDEGIEVFCADGHAVFVLGQFRWTSGGEWVASQHMANDLAPDGHRRFVKRCEGCGALFQHNAAWVEQRLIAARSACPGEMVPLPRSIWI